MVVAGVCQQLDQRGEHTISIQFLFYKSLYRFLLTSILGGQPTNYCIKYDDNQK